MYHSYYGLVQSPFEMTPDPAFLYLGDTHREGLATLVYGVQARKGFVLLTGEIGTGKTTLLHVLLGILRLQEGTVHFGGRLRQELTRREVSRLMGLVPQDERIPFEFTVNVEKGLLSPIPRGNGDVGPGLQGNPGLRSVSLAFENGEEIATGSDAQCVSMALLVIMFAYDTAIA